MEIRRVGRSGLEVSRLGLGTMTWGRDTDADTAAAQLEAFVGAGGTLVDTSNVYGDGDCRVDPRHPGSRRHRPQGRGAGDHDGGRGRRSRPAARRAVGLAAPARHRVAWICGWCTATTTGCRSRRPARRCAPRWRPGRAAYVGVSGYSGWQLATAATWLRTQGCPVVAVETEYSLVDRSPEESLLPAAAALGVGVLAWAPLGRGVLTGKYRHGTPGRFPGRLTAFRPVRRSASERRDCQGGGGGGHGRRRARARRHWPWPAPGSGTSPASRRRWWAPVTRRSCWERLPPRRSRCRSRSGPRSTTCRPAHRSTPAHRTDR